MATPNTAAALSPEKRAALADAEALRRRIDGLRTRVRQEPGRVFGPVVRLANAAEDLPTEAMAYGARTSDDLREIIASIAEEVDEIEREYVSPELHVCAKEPAEADLLDVPILVPGEAWRYEEGADGWDTPWRPVTLRAGEAEGAAYRGMVSTTGGRSGPKGTFHLFEWPDGQRAAQRAGMSPPSRNYGDRAWRVAQRKEQNVARDPAGFNLDVQDGRARKRGGEQPRLAGLDAPADTRAMYEKRVRDMAGKAGARLGLAAYNDRLQAGGLPRVRTLGEVEREQATATAATAATAAAAAAAAPAPTPGPTPKPARKAGDVAGAKKPTPATPAKKPGAGPKAAKPKKPTADLLAALAALAAEEDAASFGAVDWTSPGVDGRQRERAVEAGLARITNEHNQRQHGPLYRITPAGRNALALAAAATPKPARRRDPIARRFAWLVKDSERTRWTDGQAAKSRAASEWLYAAHVAADLVRERPRSIEAIVRDGDQDIVHGRRPGARVSSDTWREVMKELAAGRYIEPTGTGDEYRRTREVLPFQVAGARVITDPGEARRAFDVETLRERVGKVGRAVRELGDPALLRELGEVERLSGDIAVTVDRDRWQEAWNGLGRLDSQLDARAEAARLGARGEVAQLDVRTEAAPDRRRPAKDKPTAKQRPAKDKPTAKQRPRQEPARVRGDKIIAATIRELAKEPRGLQLTTGDGFVIVAPVGAKWRAFLYRYGVGAGIKEAGPPENYKRALERAVAMGGDITFGAPLTSLGSHAVETFVKIEAQARQAPRTRPFKAAPDKAAPAKKAAKKKAAKKKAAKKKAAKKKAAKKKAAKINARELARGTLIELAEHPTIDKKQARQLARDHLRENPAAYRGKRAPKPSPPKPAKVEPPRCASALERMTERYEASVKRRAGVLKTRQDSRRDALVARQQDRERTLAGLVTGSPKARARAAQRLKAAEKRHKQQRLELDRRDKAEHAALKDKVACPILTRARAATLVRLGCGELCHLTVAGGIGGDQAMVALPSARSAPRTLPARFVLVSAASLVASHDPATFDPRPDYPSKVQERRYERDNLEKGKVISIAQSMLPALIENTNPGAIDGTPIITTSGIVLSGNGRTMGTQRHYLSGRRVLAEWLEQHAGQFGIDPRAVRTIKDPIVVRVVDVPAAEWGRLVRDFNVSLTQRMSAEVEAAALARQLPPDVPRLLRDGNADAGLAEYLTSRASLPLVGALERSGYVNAANRSRLLGADGLLSTEGRADFERMMVAAVIPVEYIERSPELARALDRSAVSWLAAAGAGPDWDIRADLAAAAEDYLALRSSKSCLAQWQEQASLVTPATKDRPMARTLLEVLDLAAARPVVFARIAAAFAKSSRAGDDLFSTVEPLDALQQAAASGGVDTSRAASRRRCRKAA